MDNKKMREYKHEELVELVKDFSEQEIIDFSSSRGGYPVLLRMLLNPEICHIPILQDGAAIIIRNFNGDILLQERTDRNLWGLPGGCQELGEDFRVTAIREAKEETNLELEPQQIELIDILSGESRRNSYPSGDIVYNNTALYLADVNITDLSQLKGDSETKKLAFFSIDNLPSNLMDKDLIEAYKRYISRKR